MPCGQLVHTTSSVGRAGPWSKEQLRIIDQSLPSWYDFCIVRHGDLRGRDPEFTKWKKTEADNILSRDEFKTLPENLSVSIF
jgi:hypothetical protein